MKVKCPRCDYKGEAVDGKCSICDLPLEPSRTLKIPKNIYTIIALILIVFIFGFTIYGYLHGNLNGEVFIVTKGGQIYRLALVEVRLIPKNTFVEYVTSRQEEISKEREKLHVEAQKASDEAHSEKDSFDGELKARVALAIIEPKFALITSQPYFFREVPEGISEIKTDADGKFNLQARRGTKLILFAHGSRLVGDETEHYYWALPVKLNLIGSTNIVLNNDNLIQDNSYKINKPSF